MRTTAISVECPSDALSAVVTAPVVGALVEGRAPRIRAGHAVIEVSLPDEALGGIDQLLSKPQFSLPRLARTAQLVCPRAPLLGGGVGDGVSVGSGGGGGGGDGGGGAPSVIVWTMWFRGVSSTFSSSGKNGTPKLLKPVSSALCILTSHLRIIRAGIHSCGVELRR